MLTQSQISQLQRARETLTAVQAKAEACTERGFDQGRIVEACAHAELSLFEVINLAATFTAIADAFAEAS